MKLQLIGCSHHECSIELRERIAISESQVPDMLARFQDRFPDAEAVLLSTCNRTELYAASANPDLVPSPRELADFLTAERIEIDTEQVFNELFRYTGEDAIRHLFMVAASLDSMVVGEAQILSQVKQAYRVASERNSAGQLTHSAFQAAIKVAKRVATEPAIQKKRLSIPSVAIGDFARQIFERLDDKSILVIGAGEMADESLTYLKSENAHNVTVVNRSPDRAQELVDKFGGKTAPWDSLEHQLELSDLVISTTAAQEPIIDRSRFEPIQTRRHQRPMFIMDLAVPRDFDPAIGDCLGVYLYSLDDLAQVCENNLKARQSELPKAQHIVDEETTRFMRELQHKATGPTIQRLRESAEIIRDAELQRLMNKLTDADDHTRQEIQQSFRRLVNKILHPPLESLKQETSDTEHARLLDALKRLFRLRD
ncbi:MAG: glutamyl-tRNA reductase [Planctomycetota bacterium]